ncbi:SCO-spondin-like [Asterias rubens]|uniref:SCO-spondin-like n=1 Tax=Asterias rubens TaxID=7604 RepID=UPI001455C108|nr:SCO-spondin-like [Asterias rubens]
MGCFLLQTYVLFEAVVKLLLVFHAAGLVKAGWTPWSSWTTCSMSCGDGGFTTRSRTCLDDGSPCVGDNFDAGQCNMDPCPIDGVWLEWTSWTNCTLVCGSGTQYHQRECKEPKHGGMPCQGNFNETEACNVDPCPVDGNWTQWSDWKACPVSCGGSTHARNRTCIGPFHGGLPCEGVGVEERDCNPDPCPIDGSWADWADWSECSSSCNFGQQFRRRTCDNPAPQYGGVHCPGQGKGDRLCFLLFCPQHGGWSLWSPWSGCSETCDWGFRERWRSCDNPEPAWGGYYCIGTETSGESCMETPCPVDASWGTWSEWSPCSQSCGSGGNFTHTRECDFPPPMYGGKDCSGSDWQMADCYVDRCEDDGGWSDWTEWSSCSKECETGIQVRDRTCDNPTPTLPDGEQCHGPANETRVCNTHICPVHGGWSAWSIWTLCPVTCGGDIETRYRTCNNPPPLFNGDDCPELANAERDCSTNGCPVDGAWTTWSSWAECFTSCGGGMTSRTRTCTNPETVWGGIPCPEADPSEEWDTCNEFPCPIPGGWSEWSAWLDCPVTCGGHELLRDRVCDDPVPQHGGETCPGDSQDSTVCNDDPCPVNGSWTEWSSWSECSVLCEGGLQSRERTCADPAPAHGGANCHGNWTDTDSGEETENEERGCNPQMCPVHGGFTQWTEWQNCPVSCGGATIYRHRNCTDPAPMYGGVDCAGSNRSHKICNGDVQCPIHGNWGRWLDWAPCSKLCENGTTSRIRLCNDPSPLYNGDTCEGDMKEYTTCNTHTCPIHGGYSLWTPWSQCTKSCGGGQTQRTRQCDSPAPSLDGNPCVGTTIEKRLCSAFYCPVHGGFSPWGEWTQCPVTCGGAQVNHTRVCNNPTPRYDGRQCEGPTVSGKLCAGVACPIDGLWTSWLPWSQCSVTCGDGHQLTNRSCSDPSPAFGGFDCVGEGYREIMCYNQDQCPVLPPVPFNITFSVSKAIKGGLVSVYVNWDVNQTDVDYFIVQAKRLNTQGVPKGNASAYEWQTYGTVMGIHRLVPVRDNPMTGAGLFEGDFKVRVIAGNQFLESSSEELSFNVIKYLTGGSQPSAGFSNPELVILLTAFSVYLQLYSS